MTLLLVLIAAALLALSGPVCLLAPRGSPWGDRVFAMMMLVGGALGAGAAAGALPGGVGDFEAAWGMPEGRAWFHLDALSAVFLLPVFIVPALGALYGAAYWREGHAPSARQLRVFYGLLPCSMALVVLAGDGVLFLVAWEVMALSAFFSVATDDRKPDVRRDAWVYFVAAHVGTLVLFALFAMLRAATGTFDLTVLPADAVSPALATGIFLAALVGFGLKAGIMPLHVWLPGAHASAPSHVSAILSGVMLKMGVYGLIRVISMFAEVPAWWGWLVVSVGGVSAVVGIAFAISQGDYKRLLAYSSIENVGVIMLGVGAAMVGRATGHPLLAAFALTGALLHAWNHALFKSMLFLVAGSVLHATDTRHVERLGGLARVMPWTAAVACLGCIAIGAMPPLNGFASEWMIYRGYLDGVAAAGRPVDAGFAAGTAALALTGALACVAFVRFYTITFLGSPRSELAHAPRESPAAMLVPMGVLAVFCVAVGVAPSLVMPLLGGAVRLGLGASAQSLSAASVVPLQSIGLTSTGILGTALMGVLLVRRGARVRCAPRRPTWGCGYTRPSARMQYTGSSLGQMVVGLFRWALMPRERGPSIEGPFPGVAAYRSEAPDAVLDRAIRPGLHGVTRVIMRLRQLQQAKIQIYMVYILLIVIVLLVLVRSP